MAETARILLIEDSRTQAERVRLMLEKEGWRVSCASSAESALDDLGRVRPDLIVADYHLPGMSGAEFCRRIRMNVNTRGIPVLMLTVEGTEAGELRGLESGADDYLTKDVDPDVLLLRVRTLLRQSPAGAPILAVRESSFSRARLLIVDESPTFVSYLAQELGSEHYDVEQAAGGRQGLERMREAPFDCVLVALEMAEMNGVEFCRRALEVPRNEVPIGLIVLAEHEAKEDMTRSLAAGADDCIAKSADVAVLKSRVRSLLRRRFYSEENRRLLDEIKEKELAAVRARVEREAAEKLARTNQELEKANRKLKEALEITRAITDHAAEALFLLDAGGRVTFLNPAAERMFGFAALELLGEALHDRIQRPPGGPAVPLAESQLGQSLASGSVVIGREDEFYRADGSPVQVSWSNAPITQDGRVTGAVLAVHDISERKRAEDRLRQAQKLESIGLLAGGIAHDFNNILTTIIGTASLVEQDGLPGETGEMIRTILSAADKAADLTRQLLAYAGQGRFVVEPIYLSDLVREMSTLVRLSVPRNIEVRFDLCDELPFVQADTSQMRQVLMNLVINAGEAIAPAESGKVVITTGLEAVRETFFDAAGTEVPPGRYVRLEVSDTGCGMDPETLGRIFEPFFSTKFTGRGLGLAAVSGVLRAQKGAITVRTAPGAGCTFRVLFPVPEGQGDGPRPVVLIADDEPAVRDFLRGALERQGYRVLVAADGRQALELWEEHHDRIRLVLIDLIMPVMGGRELLAEIKRRAPDVRILLTSGYSEAEVRRLCASYEDATFIQKPYSSHALIQKVKAALAQ